MRELNLQGSEFSELAAEILGRGGTFCFSAHGSSMLPFIRDGDVLIIQPAEAMTLEVGDAALYHAAAKRLVAHRVVGKDIRSGRVVLVLRGDERGFFLIPYEGLFKIESLFDEISVWIRKIIITGIAVIWLVSPIDLFPDSVPILGAIDDALIALVGAGQWIGTIKRKKIPGP